MQALSSAQLHELQQNFLDEAAEKGALIGPLVPINDLRAQYEGGSMSFVQKIDWLRNERGFRGIRRTRGDGDCFYRCMSPCCFHSDVWFRDVTLCFDIALAFSYIERIMHAPDVVLAVVTAISTLEASLKKMEEAGFQAMVYEGELAPQLA